MSVIFSPAAKEAFLPTKPAPRSNELFGLKIRHGFLMGNLIQQIGNPVKVYDSLLRPSCAHIGDQNPMRESFRLRMPPNSLSIGRSRVSRLRSRIIDSFVERRIVFIVWPCCPLWLTLGRLMEETHGRGSGTRQACPVADTLAWIRQDLLRLRT
jgi:hypothetical protein